MCFLSQQFSEVMTALYEYVDEASGRTSRLIDEKIYNVIIKNRVRIFSPTTGNSSFPQKTLFYFRQFEWRLQPKSCPLTFPSVRFVQEELDAAIIYDRDYNYDYFGFKTLERSYLLKVNGQIVERPQHMLMRVSIGIHQEDVAAAIETYNLMSQKYFTHASPTLFNAGTPKPQMSSCFLVHMKEDSIEGIYDTLKICAQISKSAGGIGLSIHNIRARNSYIRGTNGTSVSWPQTSLFFVILIYMLMRGLSTLSLPCENQSIKADFVMMPAERPRAHASCLQQHRALR
jgi:hypothetical protein